ncbi:alpha-amylase family glycosyl hydrolase [Steroidobacter cummioxidans]|uniref:alpha-amylase family glycosyl hydrolase n=1 Tax=Steroidobacter cummioxidans TaxID=1803913 RepID=UPI000E320770|nr:alpha-amylase family glycosyl hydrolase [Steroidobacter cummioxidans]
MQTRWLRTLIVALCALACASHATDGPVEFDTTGGDAWTLVKRIEGRVDPSACDQVLIRGPAGTAIATLQDHRFWASVPLRSGDNEIRARCNRHGRDIAHSSTQHWLARIEDRPRAWIRTRIDGQTILMDAGGSRMAAGISAPITRYEWRSQRGNAAPLILTTQSLLDITPATTKNIQIKTPDADGEYYVTLRVSDALGRSDEGTTVFEVVDGSPKEVDPDRHRPAWISQSVLYGVAPFAFGHNGYDDVRKRLPEIAALGVTAIWLSPVTGAPPEDFGYAVTDHFQSRAEFGTKLQLKALIEAAHAHGLRVLIDFIPNHLATAHPYYIDAARQLQRSPYFNWFERDASGQTMNYFDWSHLKNLEYDNPEVQRYMIEAFSYWVRELNIDGFRVDVSWGVRERAPEFWPRWRQELKRIDPDMLLIAEASALDGYYFQHGFDAAYDWTGKLGEWAWNDAFAGTTPDLTKLRAALLNSSRDLPEPGLVLRFLNNNDTGARFITRHGAALTRVAATLLLTLPGLPLIYNGDEVGAQFLPYDEQPLSWDDRHHLLQHYTKLVRLRKEVAALRSPEIELIATNRDDAVLAYIRRPSKPAADCHDSENALVLLNFSAENIDLKLSPVTALSSSWWEKRLQDRLTGEYFTHLASQSLRLEPFDARVLTADACN